MTPIIRAFKAQGLTISADVIRTDRTRTYYYIAFLRPREPVTVMRVHDALNRVRNAGFDVDAMFVSDPKELAHLNHLMGVKANLGLIATRRGKHADSQED
jgi:hypothetical protein